MRKPVRLSIITLLVLALGVLAFQIDASAKKKRSKRRNVKKTASKVTNLPSSVFTSPVQLARSNAPGTVAGPGLQTAAPRPVVQITSGDTSGTPKKTKWSYQTRKLRVEAPEISVGALTDQEIQNNPDTYSLAADKSGPPEERPLVVPAPAPDAPALGANFNAINFNENATLNGFFQIPPDPSGAVGLNHVVNVTNSAIEWYTKAGVRQNRQTLSSFFATAPTPPQTLTFDPKVIYDQYENRFVVTTMERIEASGMIPNQSRVYFAVSDDNDPNGTWRFVTLTTEETIDPPGAPPPQQTWADFPGLSVDSEAIYYTNNQFSHNNQTQAGFFQGQRLRIIAKAPFYSGGAATFASYDPATLASANPAGDNFALVTTMQPTQMYGDLPGGLGTFLIAYSGINDGTNLFVQIIQVDSPLSSPTFTGYFSQWGTVAANDSLLAFPGAPQLGTTRTIATNDRRFSQHGVYRNGFLYCAAPTRVPAAAPVDGGQVTAHWWVLDPVILNTGPVDPPPVDQGNIGGEDIAPGTFTFFPSVAVDSAGNLAIGFAASAPTLYPGAYFTGRLASDPLGTVQGAGGLRAGQDHYVRDFTTSMTVASRWGDYSGIWLDPSNETTFWVFNEYALPRGTVLGGLPEEDGRWGNAWGSFTLAPAAVPVGSVLISEFRLRGPGGTTDEFIELYNNTDSTITVEDVNPPATGPSGWAIVSADAPTVAKVVVPTGVTIPARGHYLVANSAGYSLGTYPSGNIGTGTGTTTATPNRTYTTDIPDNRGLAIFRSANLPNFTTFNRLDAVGPASEANVLFKEGTGLPDLSAAASEYSWVRRLPGGCTGTNPGFINHNCTTPALVQNTPPSSSGNSQDTNNNVTDFIYVEANGSSNPATNQRLGAPGPENLTSPIVRTAPSGAGTINPSRVDPLQSVSAPPNQVRDLTVVTNGTFGTLDIRRKFTNNTAVAVSRLRFRIMDISTFPTPAGIADLRALTSGDVGVTITGGSPVTVRGTTLETPPAQSIGGAFNSTLSAGIVTLSAPLAAGSSIDMRFLFGVQATGKFRVFVIVEALP